MVLGSGALQIGQAGEFDYSGFPGDQGAARGRHRYVLVNPNIATIQTKPGLAERIYLAAVTPELVEKIIAKEGVDAIALGFGGQTALNCGLALHDAGVLAKHGIQVLGTPIQAIRDTEDRRLFVERLAEIASIPRAAVPAIRPTQRGARSARSGFRSMLRGGYALGGKGSGIVRLEAQDRSVPAARFRRRRHPGIVEQCLEGWKEIEYEVVRDARDNCVTVCNMENVDPMGIHTAIRSWWRRRRRSMTPSISCCARLPSAPCGNLGIVGECNIQFALDPNSTESRHRSQRQVSRSSALASKATGYPLAYVAAKLALGYALTEIPNAFTRRTTSFFEPALITWCASFRAGISPSSGARRRGSAAR